MVQCGVVLGQFVAIGCSNAHTFPLEGTRRSDIFSFDWLLQLLQHILQDVHLAGEHINWYRALHWFKINCLHGLNRVFSRPFYYKYAHEFCIAFCNQNVGLTKDLVFL